MAKTSLLPSQIVGELASLASSGTYNVTPVQSQRMNALFVVVAELINQLEEAEKEQAAQLDEQANQAPREDVEDEGGAS